MNVWRGRLSRWFAPAARSCPLSPNAISLIALALNVAAAALLARGARAPSLFLIAIVLIIAGGLADAFDGIVARAQKKESRFGDFLDHVADRISDTCLAAGWLVGNHVREPLLLAGVILVMLNGYIGTQIEATWRERSYEVVGRGEFVLALVILPIVSYIVFSGGWSGVRLGGLSIAESMTVLLIVFAVLGVLQRIALARRMDRKEPGED